jgi:hypothetical protein
LCIVHIIIALRENPTGKSLGIIPMQNVPRVLYAAKCQLADAACTLEVIAWCTVQLNQILDTFRNPQEASGKVSQDIAGQHKKYQ